MLLAEKKNVEAKILVMKHFISPFVQADSVQEKQMFHIDPWCSMPTYREM